MVHAAHFAAAAAACYVTALVLTRVGWVARRWAWHSPRIAIVCWQSVGLALGLSAIGLPISLGLSPYGTGTGTALVRFAVDLFRGSLPDGLGLPHLALVAVGFAIAGLLISATVRSVVSTLRAQRRHRELLALVARNDPAAPGALVLDHPSAAAYCLPGARPRVVVSAGTLSLLDRPQLAAVLTHERAHAAERHDLVLLPFTALCRALPWARWVRDARETVALLVEMRADDKARQVHPDKALAAALLRFADAPARITPVGALGIADSHLDARVQRLLMTSRPPLALGLAALAVAGALVGLPISLFLA